MFASMSDASYKRRAPPRIITPPMDLLLVEDDDDFRTAAVRWMERKGHGSAFATNGRAALEHVRQRRFDVAILDLNLPDISGLDLLRQLRVAAPETEVIFLTGQATVETAVEAMKCGACDYLAKPFPLAELEERCRKAAERARLRRDTERWKAVAIRSQPATVLVGSSPRLQDVQRLIARVGPTDASVLIQGETGTGKELAARAIQQCSRRRDQPFVTLNCAALPEQLVESELFGYEKGAFTGAARSRPGLFEIADEGTLFIDEIGELPLALQPKLLRVLEDGSFRRVGGSQERRVDVRIIAATNRDLGAEVRAHRFREDLLYRINVMNLMMPPLREHAEDIPQLVRHFLPADWEIDDEAAGALVRYAWPGNVRQLRNVLERATILADGQTVTLDDLPAEIAAASSEEAAPSPPGDLELMAMERAHIRSVLRRCQGNKAQAARVLGIHRRKLYRLLERLGIEDE
jgi:DNA-binding NtrC family response regulator